MYELGGINHRGHRGEENEDLEINNASLDPASPEQDRFARQEIGIKTEGEKMLGW